MRGRCNTKKDKAYNDYGGRGIGVCKEWEKSFLAFYDWATHNGWRKGLFIDRIDNDGGYAPGNCRFVDVWENSHNCRLLRKNNTSGYRGVCWDKSKNKWLAGITINRRKKHLGRFDSPTLAALRYDAEAYRLDDGRPRNIF